MAAMADHPDAKDKVMRVGNYSLDGLSISWENLEKVRARFREHKCLLLQFDTKLGEALVPGNGHVSKSIHNLRVNHFVVSPLVHLVRRNDLLLPNFDRLHQELQILYERNHGNFGNGGDVLYHNAWSIRHLLSLLKGELAKTKKDLREGKYKPNSKDCKISAGVAILLSMVPCV